MKLVSPLYSHFNGMNLSRILHKYTTMMSKSNEYPRRESATRLEHMPGGTH
jgi:hypothetical protein